jgi:LPXTG-motif cell wall-anchored protein
MGVRAIGVRAAGVVAGLCLFWAPSAAGAGGPIIPEGSVGFDGVAPVAGGPAADVRYLTFTISGQTVVERISAHGGERLGLKFIDGEWRLPAVTINGDAGGLSADGRRLVLIGRYSRRDAETRLAIFSTKRRIDFRETLVLDGRYSFDAISPDGRLLYLVEYQNPHDPLDYRVRAYDLAAGAFRPGRIVDPEEPDEQMAGQPIARQTSPDGRWAYTLYGGGDETFIHALDTEGATAVCVDLDQFGPRAMYRLGLEVDSATGAITVLKANDPAAVVDPETFEVGTPPADQIGGDVGDGVAHDQPADSGGSAIWAIAGGSALLAGGAFLFLRRRRRRRSDDSIDEEALERLVRTDSANADEDREREPVL